jgi:hypothetical protein
MTVVVRIVGNAVDPTGTPLPGAPPLGEFDLFITGLQGGSVGQVIISRTDGPQQDLTNWTADAGGNVATREQIQAPQLRSAFEAFGEASWTIVDEPVGGRDDRFRVAVGTIVIEILARIPPGA